MDFFHFLRNLNGYLQVHSYFTFFAFENFFVISPEKYPSQPPALGRFFTKIIVTEKNYQKETAFLSHHRIDSRLCTEYRRGRISRSKMVPAAKTAGTI